MILRRLALPALVALALALQPALAGPARATDSDQEDPKELAREGMERMLRAIELMIEMIPQYDMPEVNEDGDIIIRRRNPPRHDDSSDDEEPDETKT